MEGTIVITGATGSLALQAIQQIISMYPSISIIATARDPKASPKSPYLLQLEETRSHHGASKFLIEYLDLSSIPEVRAFTSKIVGLVDSQELPPIKAIFCNAFTWSLDGLRFSSDRMESTFQVNHLAHFLLVLRLLQSMDHELGRIVMFSSEVHDPENINPLSKLGAKLPTNENLDQLIKPGPDRIGSEHDMGWRRYANSKLANVMFMQSLNKRLQKSPKLSKITVTAVDPGGLVESRAHEAQRTINRILFWLFAMMLPIVNVFTNKLRSNANSARDVVALGLGPEFASRRGHFNGRRAQPPARISEDDERCEALWKACWKWVDMKQSDTCVSA
ncbi:Short-chain dehydrogenase/reductase SDR [Penicillium brevicompactum]|uniref:Short-chain dehydrogenase/reductase SDR n=1 Tax=Penicillium brevicompactum TaxID=5074 RepID=UPI0025413628|nr:Short-chain dehydrogenase/reductase SDR [Penicillium brevicompactum]KAJ5332783.1 Short-chain dehydrogenase/reductase SDR [Penicillium brevicompactum]